MRLKTFAGGLVLLLAGLTVFVPSLSLVQAYQARPDAPNGGLRVAGYFIRLSSMEALVGLSLGLIIVLLGLAVTMGGAVKKRPTPISKTQ